MYIYIYIYICICICICIYTGCKSHGLFGPIIRKWLLESQLVPGNGITEAMRHFSFSPPPSSPALKRAKYQFTTG